MKGSQLAQALSSITRQRPDLDDSLHDHLKKWVNTKLLKTATITLEELRQTHRSAGDAFVEWWLNSLPDTKTKSLAKRLDPHNTCPDPAAHIRRLASERLDPTPKPVNPDEQAIVEALQISSPEQRRRELQKLSAKALKAAIKEHGIYASSISGRPSKTELIEHIQAAIADGWPQKRSVLHGSKY